MSLKELGPHSETGAPHHPVSSKWPWSLEPDIVGAFLEGHAGTTAHNGREDTGRVWVTELVTKEERKVDRWATVVGPLTGRGGSYVPRLCVGILVYAPVSGQL